MPSRRTSDLHHHRWSATGVRYFITVCTQEHRAGLTNQKLLAALLSSIRDSDSLRDTSTIAFTAMPDHMHWLLQLGERLSLGRVIARFKAQTRFPLLTHDISWQRDFFEHRLRAEESIEDYALYVFLNPYRARLAQTGTWPGWWSASPETLRFVASLNPDGSPPAEWLAQEPPHPLITGE